MTNWREQAWEGTVTVLSWIVVLVALAGIVGLVAYDALKSRRASRRKGPV